MSALSRIRTANVGTRHRMTRIASVAATVAAISSPLPAAAAPWELRLANDSDFISTFTLTWTFDNFSFKPSDVRTFAPGELNVYKPAVGPVETDDGTLNRLPNDYHVHTETKRHGKTITTDWGAIVPQAGTSDDIGKTLDKFPGRSEILMPIPTQLHDDDPGIFTGVNLAEYLAAPLDMTPSSLSFVDGVSPELPGYVVGLSPVTIDPITGNYVTSDPFTGDVEFDSIATLATIPEPQSWLLFALGLAALSGLSRLKRGAEPSSIS